MFDIITVVFATLFMVWVGYKVVVFGENFKVCPYDKVELTFEEYCRWKCMRG